MEWATEQALRCPGCGNPRDVCMREGADQDFEVDVMQCHACLAIGNKKAGWKGDNLHALSFGARYTGPE